VGWIRRFIIFHGKRHPDEMGEAEIGAYPSHLANDSKVSASTQNQALSARCFCIKKCSAGRSNGWAVWFTRSDR
jgi:hypothetical protein